MDCLQLIFIVFVLGMIIGVVFTYLTIVKIKQDHIRLLEGIIDCNNRTIVDLKDKQRGIN